MPKISWNDIDDDDSSLSSDGEQLQKIILPNKVIEPSTSKLKNACDQMSLKKLQSHQSNDVWLYIPNSFYERGDDVNAILDNNKQLKKVYRIKSIGWNVLTSKQIGRNLIQEGLQEDNIFIKFIYSNKNQQKINTFEEKPKIQKKVTYVQKASKASQEEKVQQPKQEGSKIQSRDQPQKREDKDERKKVKYVQKSKSIAELQNQSTIRGDQKVIRTTQSFKSPQRISQSNHFKSPRKYKLKQQIVQQQGDKAKRKVEQQPMLPKKSSVQVKQQSMATESQPINVQQNKDDDLSKQQKKKKKRKNNKKNKAAKVERIDHNPYSYFMK